MCWERHGDRSMWQLVTPHLPSAERWMPERVVPSRCPARGTVHPHLGWDFPLQLNLETLLQTGVEVHVHGVSKPHQVALKIKYHRHRVTPPSSIKELSFDSGECVDESKRKKNQHFKDKIQAQKLMLWVALFTRDTQSRQSREANIQ